MRSTAPFLCKTTNAVALVPWNLALDGDGWLFEIKRRLLAIRDSATARLFGRNGCDISKPIICSAVVISESTQ